MIKQLFETMNDVLDEIEKEYPTAEPAYKQELGQKLNALKSMSDHLIEEWLKFEERVGKVMQGHNQQDPAYQQPQPQQQPQQPMPDQPHGQQPKDPASQSEEFSRGQGYFQLLMFENAIRSFEQVVKQFPDFMLGRFYLAMGHMRNGDEMEAYRHFKFIISLTDQAPMKAISYNAMGCIHAKNDNLEQAQQFFKLAYMTDPSCVQPIHNMEVCAQQASSFAAPPDFLH